MTVDDVKNYGAIAVEDEGATDKLTACKAEWRRFGGLLGAYLVFVIMMFSAFVEYPPVGSFNVQDDVQYLFYLNVTVMMIIGFGALMAFQRHNGLTAIGFSFLITVIAIPLCVLTGRFFASVAGNDDYACLQANQTHADGAPDLPCTGKLAGGPWTHAVLLNVQALLQGNFAAAAVLISFGAVIGKVTPSQIVVMAVVEVVLYSLNKEVLCIGLFGTLDMGGTIFIHLFGAYFGLAVAYMLGRPDEAEAGKAEPSRVSDIFSLIGTAFLWIYWPSFNGATAGVASTDQQLTTVNTVLALCGSAVATFLVSVLLNGKINTVDVQNAALAGGVAIGASSNLRVSPGAALAVGVAAALISTCGFNRLQGFVEAKLGLHDSCGIHNLHGMPALFGSLVVTVAVAVKSTQGDVVYPHPDGQAWAQLAGAGATLVVAIVGGLLTGLVLNLVCPQGQRQVQFDDAAFWTVAAPEDSAAQAVAKGGKDGDEY